jgi:hypothetical protein
MGSLLKKMGMLSIVLALPLGYIVWLQRAVDQRTMDCQRLQHVLSGVADHARGLEVRLAFLKRMASYTCLPIETIAVAGYPVMAYNGGLVPEDMIDDSQDRGEMGIASSVSNLSVANNNLLNVKGGERWAGEIGRDSAGHAKFEHPLYSIRAGAMTLRTYAQRHGIRTVRGIIDRFCQAPDELKERYVSYVASRVGVGPDEEIPILQHLPALLMAMVKFESGVDIPGAWVASYDILKESKDTQDP